MRRLLFLAALLLSTALFAQTQAPSKVPDAAQFVGQPQGKPLSGDALFQRANEVSALIRCPVCQGLSVADSPSEMAVNMKAQVSELLARGYTQEQILRYFELSYGQFVLLKPKFEGINSFVWLLPVIALALGIFVVVAKMKKLSATAPPATVPPTSPDDEYLDRVRRMVGEGKP